MGYKIGVDTGGTFTDIAMIESNSGEISITKVPSTPDNPAAAVVKGIDAVVEKTGLKKESIDFLIHGTTVATNSLLEQKGAKTALITTEGFKDVLHIARQTRPSLYDFWARKPDPVVPRRLRFEALERILYTGKVQKNLDTGAIYEIIKKLNEEKVESVAVCLLHSYINSKHENMIKEIIERECPDIFVTISSEVLAEFREYERTSTVAVNAFVMPEVNNYLSYLADELQEMKINSDLYIMQSNGGVITADTAQKVSARTVLSGPAGGAMAGKFICEQTGRNNLITADMGGTSLDVCLLEKKTPNYTTQADIGGNPIKLPMIDINTIGSGGGSIAWIDSGGALRVGPYSAGAEPGPVCYGKGGSDPTVTDANVVLGRINPEYILGGKMKVDLEGAVSAIRDKISKPLGLEVEEAARGILRVVNANMVRGIRVISVEKGYDPRDFSLAAFGGAGPLHAGELAEELGIGEVIIPISPGVSSALGMLSADVRHDFVYTRVVSTDMADPRDIQSRFEEMEEKAQRQLFKERFHEDEIYFNRSIDMSYKGQAFELNLEVDSRNISKKEVETLMEKFHNKHLGLYGYKREKETVEFVNLRLAAIGKLPRFSFKKNEIESKDNKCAPMKYREVFFHNDYYKTPVYEREMFSSGHKIEGPAIIEQLDSTTVVFPGKIAEIDPYLNIIINDY